MHTIPFNFRRIQIGVLLLINLLYMDSWAQDSTVTEKTVPLNLDTHHIVKELLNENQTRQSLDNPLETIKIEPNQLDESFRKAAKHGAKPDITEMHIDGAPERVTKVTGADGSYCVYSPTVARTDGIDAIQNGLQNQVRSCPQ